MGGAPELCKYGDTYYIYNIEPYMRDDNDYKSSSVWALTAKDILNGPWDGPFFVGPAFNLDNDRELVDPGHIEDFDGKRWMYMGENICFPLSQDGLHFAGPGKRVLPDEEFPDDWEIQGVYTEGPRLMKRDGWIYLTLAAGGTEGPPTSHGVFLYRSKKADGPWEKCPFNPLMRTFSRHDKWLSRGHAMPVEAPDGSWYLVYHGIRKNRYNHGRQLLMEPIEWTDDGWYRLKEENGSDKALPAPKGGKPVLHGYPARIQFPITEELPGQYIYFGDIKERIENRPDGLAMKGNGMSLHDTKGVLCYRGLFDNFELVTEVTVENGAGAGIAMYYSPMHSVGFALKDEHTWVFNCTHFNLTRRYNGIQWLWDHAWLKLTVRHQVVSMWISADGKEYQKLLPSFNIMFINFMAFIPRPFDDHMIYPALFTYGTGTAIFHRFEMNQLVLKD
jgi:beta-xylosidase